MTCSYPRNGEQSKQRYAIDKVHMPILAVGGQARVVADRWLGGLADCCAHARCGGARRPPNRVDRQIHEEELSTAIYKITQSNPELRWDRFGRKATIAPKKQTALYQWVAISIRVLRGVTVRTSDTWHYGTAPSGGNGEFGTVVFNDITHTATLTRLLTNTMARCRSDLGHKSAKSARMLCVNSSLNR
jgi:hypothetical protein